MFVRCLPCYIASDECTYWCIHFIGNEGCSFDQIYDQTVRVMCICVCVPVMACSTHATVSSSEVLTAHKSVIKYQCRVLSLSLSLLQLFVSQIYFLTEIHFECATSGELWVGGVHFMYTSFRRTWGENCECNARRRHLAFAPGAKCSDIFRTAYIMWRWYFFCLFS